MEQKTPTPARPALDAMAMSEGDEPTPEAILIAAYILWLAVVTDDYTVEHSELDFEGVANAALTEIDAALARSAP